MAKKGFMIGKSLRKALCNAQVRLHAGLELQSLFPAAAKVIA